MNEGGLVVVVAFDGCDACLRSASYAVGMVNRHSRPARVVFVDVASNMLAAIAHVPEVAAAATQNAADVRAQIAARIASFADDEGVTWELRTCSGARCEKLRRIASDVRADVVVIARSCRGRGWRGTAGALSLIRTGDWPVIVVP